MLEKKQGDEIAIQLPVEYYRQKKKMSCWYAAARMVYSYRYPNRDFATELQKTEDGRAMHGIYSEGLAIDAEGNCQEGNLADWSTLTRAIGMQELKPLPRDARELAFHLRNKGPIWSAGCFFNNGGSKTGHIIVVVGAMKRMARFSKTATDHLIINDSAPEQFNGGIEKVLKYDIFAKRLYSPHVTNGESPMMYLPAQ